MRGCRQLAAGGLLPGADVLDHGGTGVGAQSQWHHAPMGAAAAERSPEDWVEDLTWHRRMYAESKFRWVPEDPMSLALTWTRGRLVYDSPSHLRLLDQQLLDMRGFAAQIDDAMISPLLQARRRCRPDAWAAGLGLVGMTPRDLEVLQFGAPRQITPNREAQRALRGIPLPNPFSQVWELKQVRAMYAAAEGLIDDTFCDLVMELAPAQGWTNLAQLTLANRSASSLRLRVEEQRRTRGEPGDPRRRPAQRY